MGVGCAGRCWWSVLLTVVSVSCLKVWLALVGGADPGWWLVCALVLLVVAVAHSGGGVAAGGVCALPCAAPSSVEGLAAVAPRELRRTQ